MSILPRLPRKPNDVAHAEKILWVWTAWICLFGIGHEGATIDQTAQSLNDQLQGMASIDPGTLLKALVAGYIGLAALSAWVIVRIGHGRQWARSSVLWSFILQAVVTPLPPFHALSDYLADIPDLGLQLLATVFLYTKPSRTWFEARNAAEKPAQLAR